jgi:TfoX/Sxy family transcriptional regulator of competence genes
MQEKQGRKRASHSVVEELGHLPVCSASSRTYSDVLSERKMFGGLAFMIDGNMCCGIVDDRLMLRLGADLAEMALTRPHVHQMDFTGRPMTGMVYVAPEGLGGKVLQPWVEQAAGFARTPTPKRGSRGAPELD